MSWFSNMMHPGRGYDRAGQAEQQGYNTAQGYRQPFIDKGVGAGNTLQDMLNKLVNPVDLQNEWSKGYETSPYAKQLQAEAQSGGMDAASAMGLGGSSAALSNIQKGSADIMQKDRQNYMDDLMKKYHDAMGIGENMYGVGANTANQGAQSAQSHGEWQGQNEFNKTQAGSNMLKQILGMLGGGALGGMGGDLGNSPSFGLPNYGIGG